MPQGCSFGLPATCVNEPASRRARWRGYTAVETCEFPGRHEFANRCIIFASQRGSFGVSLIFSGRFRMKRTLFAMAVLFALAATGIWAQGDRGLITGVVKDASGAAVPRALVTATHLATNTNYKTSTTDSG